MADITPIGPSGPPRSESSTSSKASARSAPSTAPVRAKELAHWQACLAEHWGLHADLQPVGACEDQNFVVRNGTGPIGVLKVMHAGCDRGLVDLQAQVLAFLERERLPVPTAKIVPGLDGRLAYDSQDLNGTARITWLQSVLPGKAYAVVRPHSKALLGEVGASLGHIDLALQKFSHPSLARPSRWDLMQSDWIEAESANIANPEQRHRVSDIWSDFAERVRPAVQLFPLQAIHGDANDYNMLVARKGVEPWRLSGWIDFGDMVTAPAVCDLAIAIAYGVLGQAHPLQAMATIVRAYHQVRPLTAEEIRWIYPLTLLRLAQSVTNAAKEKIARPDDPYVIISEKPAWDFLALSEEFSEALITARLRQACDMPAFPHQDSVFAYLQTQRASCHPVLGIDLSQAPQVSLAVERVPLPSDPRHLTQQEAQHLVSESSLLHHPVQVGYYLEPRLVYTEPAYRSGDHEVDERRTVHIGVDIFAPQGTAVNAPVASLVYAVEIRPERLDYGGMVLLEHATDKGDLFYTLYGHLAPDSIQSLRKGDSLVAGQEFARLGDVNENGGWTPHLHFQIALTTEGLGRDWPAVCLPDETRLWSAICPNPAALLKLDDEHVLYPQPNVQARLEARQSVLGGNVKLSYHQPVPLVRGYGAYLYDAMGRAYLDAYNNVPHVGHSHPRIQAVYADQTGMLNTNTRYLQTAQKEYADRLLAKLPSPFTKVFFVNSGSEANELAIRLIRAHTGQRGMVVQDHGYHGNTNTAVDVSPYKFNGPGGAGRPDWVEICQVADPYRGPFGYDDADAGEKYAADVDRAVEALQSSGHGVAGCILESFPSVGGQIIPPVGYLAGFFRRIRAAGGLCIADEVQTGLARLGKHNWGFEQQNAIPDIVVIGKPIGNGHPIGAVITTDAIAASFDNGMEFFSTFGGSTLSCRIGSEVVDIVDDEALAERAEHVGAELLCGLQALAEHHSAIGDVRGLGLFLGVELVMDRQTKEPARQWAKYVANRLREERILIGTDGPHDNVLKVRPPLAFQTKDAKRLLAALDRVLAELPNA